MQSYLANSLFSLADQMLNAHLAEELRKAFPDLKLYVPQENMAINDKSAYASSIMISRGDDDYLLDSDFLIVVIDGCEIDSGVACEIGKFAGFDLAYKLLRGNEPRPIFALYTDVRQQGRDNRAKIEALISDPLECQYQYRNLYVVGTIKDSGGCISSSISELMEHIYKYSLTLDK